MNTDKNSLDRYLQGKCTPEEKKLIEAWYFQLGQDSELDESKVEQIVGRIDNRINEEILGKNGSLSEKQNKRKLIFWYSAAAAAAVVLFFFGLQLFHKQEQSQKLDLELVDVKAPMGNNSIIVLEDQTEVELDKLKTGDTLKGNGYQVFKNEQGEVTYKVLHSANQIAYNTVKTKAGGMTSMLLSDGSRVWINSNSELTYPVEFSKENREVALEGEAYFEIEKAKDRPFYVRSSQHTIKVLGTKFNVKNYNNGYKSTLLEGRIALTNTKTQLGKNNQVDFPIVLSPNQSYDGKTVVINESPEKVIDWKEGYFDFSDMTLDAAKDKLSAWYGLDIQVDPSLKEKRIYGQISRERSLREVLEAIKKVLPIDFEIDSKQVKIINQKK